MGFRLKVFLLDTFITTLFWEAAWLAVYLLTGLDWLEIVVLLLSGFAMNFLFGGLHGRVLDFCRKKILKGG